MEDFHQIRRLPPYVFEEINRLKVAARAAGSDIIDFGMGNPDIPTSPSIVEKLREVVQDPCTHRYSVSKGIRNLREAQSSYYARRFGVHLDPESQVIVTLGSKEGFANMAQAITAPGDVILCPNPTYPLHTFGFLMAGGVIRSIPIEPNNDFFVSLEHAMRHSFPKPSVLILNYPSNPTTYIATIDFYKEVVVFAKKHQIILLSDLAYSEIYFNNCPPPSILEVPGAVDCAVEFTTMSKTFSMAGWRIGFAVGNARLLSALSRVKSYLDYGAFTPIQLAAAHALNHCTEDVEKIRKIYKSRRDVLVKTFTEAGFDVPLPDATMFAWAKIPKPFRHLRSLEFSKILLKEANIVVAPGIGFGERGDSYVRISLVENENRILQASHSLKRFFSNLDERID
ncbi:LL-diaminopimelate aminotransferase [Candidatus Liberibacter sp.]|uniref:LL-diaminopimelate aminotransferase n=1 Tax=Candidatus Liberibacter sp. TaxID=34022 RepID=UPI0015F625B9|nr:LL-diaminopimelate aminotransferase [Candidatus Liberibacter sp.]MBA5723715.1 LL-diaminopimelate aminotransferase [Candidatus Liberibacter sp.]